MKVPKKGMYKTALGCLTAARNIIRNPRHWTQKALAKSCDGGSLCSDDGEGALTDPQVRKEVRSEKAVAFCAMGAVMFVNGPGERKARALLYKAAEEMHQRAASGDNAEPWARSWYKGPEAVFSINDYKKTDIARKNVLTLFRKAIALAKG